MMPKDGMTKHDAYAPPRGGGELPYMGFIGMCGPKGYDFQPFWS